MERDVIVQVANGWVLLTFEVLGLKKLPSIQIQDLFKRSYAILDHYHKDTMIPKEVSNMISEMDKFLSFVSTDFDDDPSYQAALEIADALKLGFFQGKYECAYPMLKVHDDDYEAHILDLEKGRIEDLIETNFS